MDRYDFRYHPAGRRAVAGRLDERRAEAGDRRPARAARRGRDRGGVPHLLAPPARRVQAHRAAGEGPDHRGPRPRGGEGHRLRGGGARRTPSTRASTPSSPPRPSTWSTSCARSPTRCVEMAVQRRALRAEQGGRGRVLPRGRHAQRDPFLCRVIEKVIDAGARDHQRARHGGLHGARRSSPSSSRAIMEGTPNMDKAVLSVHCHNDLGLAVANSVAAVRAGARQVEVHGQRHRRARGQRLAWRSS